MNRARSIEDSATYLRTIARDTDFKGFVRCIHCGGLASDVHEIIPRSYWSGRPDRLFDLKNRCCLCRECHSLLHNDEGRGKLLCILATKFGYIYEDIALCLLEEYTGVRLCDMSQ